jgi:PKD repeat protein
MAASVSSTNPQLLVTAFFNSVHNTFVIINPTASSFPGTLVRATNPGFSSAGAMEYLLNGQNPTIRKSYVPLSGAAAGFTASVDVPAYSVVALSLTASQANTAPTAMLSLTPQSGTAPLAINVDTSGSFDAGGSIVSRSIDFGDGSTPATSVAATHSYTQAGTYTVRATVVDNGGMSSHTTATVTAWNAADYKLTASVIAETSNSFNITVTPVAQLNSPVSFSCSQAPPGAACAFSPESLTPGSKSASSTLTLVAVTSASEKGKPSPIWLAMWPMLPVGLVVTSLRMRSRSTLALRQAIVAFVILSQMAMQVGCAGSLGKVAAPTHATFAGSVTVVASSLQSHSVTFVVGQ